MRPRVEAADHEDILVSHGIGKYTVDRGEIPMNYATLGSPSLPTPLMIPAQTESWWAALEHPIDTTQGEISL